MIELLIFVIAVGIIVGSAPIWLMDFIRSNDDSVTMQLFRSGVFLLFIAAIIGIGIYAYTAVAASLIMVGIYIVSVGIYIALKRINALQPRKQIKEAQQLLLREDVLSMPIEQPPRQIVEASEAIVYNLLSNDSLYGEIKQRHVKEAADKAFKLLSVSPRPSDAIDAGNLMLKTAAFAILSDKNFVVVDDLKKHPWPAFPLHSENWGERAWATVIDVWLRIIRRDGTHDQSLALDHIHDLRIAQPQFEQRYLEQQNPSYIKLAALELIGLYHLAKAGEIVTDYIINKSTDEQSTVQLLNVHFEQTDNVCSYGRMTKLRMINRLLTAVAPKIINALTEEATQRDH